MLEADWEIEIGGNAPSIEIAWRGLVDLTRASEEVNLLPEVFLLPCLGPVLLRLNAVGSPLFSVKCDVWPIDEIDPLEFDAETQAATRGFACYIDLLPRDPLDWSEHEIARAWCKQLCATLHATSLRHCRVDLVVRLAIAATIQSTIGVTAYLAACGPTEDSAKAQLGLALAAFVDAVGA